MTARPGSGCQRLPGRAPLQRVSAAGGNPLLNRACAHGCCLLARCVGARCASGGHVAGHGFGRSWPELASSQSSCNRESARPCVCRDGLAKASFVHNWGATGQQLTSQGALTASAKPPALLRKLFQSSLQNCFHARPTCQSSNRARLRGGDKQPAAGLPTL